MLENVIGVEWVRANATVAEAVKSIANIRCDMKSEIINVLDSVKTPVINETSKLPADKCASCNENESGKAGSSQGTYAGHVGLRLTPL